MANTVKEVLVWLATFDGDKMIATDDGGNTLVVYGAEDSNSQRENAAHDPSTADGYFDLGGIPFDEPTIDDFILSSDLIKP